VGFPAAEKKFQKIFLEFAWFFFKIGFFVQTLNKPMVIFLKAVNIKNRFKNG